MRFAYSDVARASFTKKNERTVRIDLQDGRAGCLVLNRGNKQQLLDLLQAHGIEVEPFTQE